MEELGEASAREPAFAGSAFGVVGGAAAERGGGSEAPPGCLLQISTRETEHPKNLN